MVHAPALPSARRGFTLVEVLVAIAIMALVAVLSWRGIDGMSRAQTLMRERADEVMTLQASLSQWKADLDALAPAANLPALDWDGRVLRLTRRSAGANPDEGLSVVAWTRRTGAGTPWLRWQSPPLRTRAEWTEAWNRAQLWGQNAGAEDRSREVALVRVDDWQLFYFRGDAWTNPLSSDASQSAAAAATSNLPDGVRLVLVLSGGQPIAGPLTLDWVRPTLGGGKS